MSRQEYADLAKLVHGIRNDLWRQRIKRTTACGVVISAAFLVLAGVSHVWLLPVPVGTWLPLALAPPLFGLVYASLLQRPDPAQAVALFDHFGAYGELLVSAWEAYLTPGHKRSAGAGAVLREAASAAPDIAVAGDWASRQDGFEWPITYTTATWVLLVAGVFLLQLPPQQTADTRAEVAHTDNNVLSVAPAARGSGAQPAGAVPASAVTAVAALQGPVAPGNSMALVADPEVSRRAQTLDTALKTPANENPTPGSESGQHKPMSRWEVNNGKSKAGAVQQAATGPGDTNDGGILNDDLEQNAGEEPVQLQLRYADIARQISAQVKETIAGTGALGFDGSGSTVLDTGLTPGKAIEPGLPTVPYSMRFSTVQRMQINAYFKQLEALP